MAFNPSSAADLRSRISSALAHLKCELQNDYERAYPALRQIIHLVLDEEESNAWKLSDFPHLLFPDLVERTSRASVCNRWRHTNTFARNSPSPLNSRFFNLRLPEVARKAQRNP